MEQTPPDYTGLDKNIDAEVRSIAESMYQTRREGVNDSDTDEELQRTNTIQPNLNVNPFLDTSDPQLDPLSKEFNSRKWIKTILGLKARFGNSRSISAGVSFKNLNAFGYGGGNDYQKTFTNSVMAIGPMIKKVLGGNKGSEVQILRHFDGLVRAGETCVVLGRPGSGCTTFLKSVACETYGFHLGEKSEWNYQGVPRDVMQKNARGEIVYNAEVDVHFPHLTVGDTLLFAALARTPQNRLEGVSREQHATHVRDVSMAMLGLTHTMDTKVGNDFVRGVSGGERKRVSIAESVVCGAPLQCWDNSTRGLDAANATEFIRSLRLSAEMTDASMFVSLYQASQEAYDMFDKVCVLYEGRQIYFGKTTEAKQFFLDLGFDCADRQTTGDFLTSLTNPIERIIRPGWESRVPRTPDDFEKCWLESEARQLLLQDIDEFNNEFVLGGPALDNFMGLRKDAQAKHTRVQSPYTISWPMQTRLCLWRGFLRIKGDMSTDIATVFGNFVMALVLSSMFYNMPQTTESFFSRGALLFFAILINAFASILEILSLYEQRPIVDKQNRYAMYHPAADALAAIITTFPTKTLTLVSVNLTIYFMTNLRREVGPFFIFFLFSLLCTMAMSMIFRTIGSVTKTLEQALAPASIIILALVIYTGFSLPISYMHGWARWINWLNPVAYGFEAVMVNEFRNREYECSMFVPSGGAYENVSLDYRSCAAVGAEPGLRFVNGDAFINQSYEYYNAHLWRNMGILFGFIIFFGAFYLFAVEYIQGAKSKGEVLVFRKEHIKKQRKEKNGDIESGVTMAGEKGTQESESSNTSINLQAQRGIYQWKDVCYDIKVKDGERRLLDHVDGFVKPGTLTALMGASGAGKTTLLDVLADRKSTGVVTGEMLVNGEHRDGSFQRKTGYVQQQDLHTATATVRESLEFSALLRQPSSIPESEKLAYVDEVIRILEMETYADAVVGVPGEGLNVEQRKRLTIGVELAAKPELLLFLDEPTSGLDSQTAWSIVKLLKKLAANGQAILCTIHQPSAILFQEFDRLLFLASGGRTVYYGDIGPQSSILTEYFERNGADPCPKQGNPAEWMLEVIGAAPGSTAKRDWPVVWAESPERAAKREELDEMARTVERVQTNTTERDSTGYSDSDQFAVGWWTQFKIVSKRQFQALWRTPSYLWSKVFLCAASAIFIGFSFFKAPNDMQGLQNKMFSFFMLFLIFNTVVEQIIPQFDKMRELYEARERSSKTYSWQVFMGSNMVVELIWQFFMGVIVFFCFYYPVGFQWTAEYNDSVHERGGLFFLYVLLLFLYNSTFAHMLIAGIDNKDTAAQIGTLLFTLMLLFCGVLATKEQMPGFWVFMYRVSPLTYFVGGMMATGMGRAPVTCSPHELVRFPAVPGKSCGEYMDGFISALGDSAGYLVSSSADMCEYCPMKSSDQFLDSVDISYTQRWRNWGILWAYPLFNIFAAFALYYFFRVPKKSKAQKA
ncbi:ABC-2 type transporter-domain-containing protein [Yarrowia lipolytica]|uniref:ABC-2 type transporter-domain-containing protein n=1 Tax=Yarrowia lipolytica TaxID=4952 RepID=A0A371BZ22_YARLL|nr:ABC-2 type transporter-domain-containing protein [Yarrowia lipolytica]RDW30083.1 ABC-2 type transporter-domain-containing protein [Yarrowia lipolytica]RDW39770.1 ABC-2 type transporter-domain-containing protein [Yarrowia lipolytica]RDW47152.1 ABC-2 type transporter-domain-containing protein [Yarrowia lipolytica]RDW53379.1 ABC-2 type transporter-domain-containing protein [Yarrowia lipolytica]